ncbi:outer membrane beta-barrel protein [Panacibacter sp. KCS-6]|uniref:Outer membrane beta-barrel protein n=2 Tax=Limnovirga soli TaxID=2656915 RepID=A0A8J8FBW2_9BACT|nr:outer membrane beta-barrel protein [Limnovirga soli]
MPSFSSPNASQPTILDFLLTILIRNWSLKQMIMAQQLNYINKTTNMKKIILAALAIIAFSTITKAQGFHLGVKGGANMNKIEGQSFKDGFNFGYQLGGFMEIDFNKKIGIQPEILFSQTNTKVGNGFQDIYDGIGSAITGDEVTLNYLNIPVLLRINAGKLLTFQVGPQYSILVNDKENLLENGANAFKKGDFAAVAGAQINLGTLKVYVRYNIGLSNINDIDNKDKWKNQQLQFGVGLRIL